MCPMELERCFEKGSATRMKNCKKRKNGVLSRERCVHALAVCVGVCVTSSGEVYTVAYEYIDAPSSG